MEVLNSLGSGHDLGLSLENLILNIYMIEIVLDIEWNGYSLRDSFKWDITDPDNCPEEFAA